jgi:hypothetical protein
MTPMKKNVAVVGMLIAVLLGTATNARAQADPLAHRWSVEIGVGFDNGISGDINTSGIGQINNQVAVITKNTYEDVYGTGVTLRFGGGYMVNQDNEVRVTFTFQNLDADYVTPSGDIGVSNLYAQFSNYQAFGMDVGLRRYVRVLPRVRVYGEGGLGLGFIDKIDVTFAAPGINLAGKSSNFYDKTAAFTYGIAAGAVFQTGEQVDVFAQLGFRYVSGLAQIDQTVGTGLDNINDKSSRWTLPFIAGLRFRF